MAIRRVLFSCKSQHVDQRVEQAAQKPEKWDMAEAVLQVCERKIRPSVQLAEVAVPAVSASLQEPEASEAL